MAGKALGLLRMTFFCERFVVWNGYAREEIRTSSKKKPLMPSCPEVGLKPPGLPPARSLLVSWLHALASGGPKFTLKLIHLCFIFDYQAL